MPRRFFIGTWGVLMLVALRLTIGWHFFNEGLSHASDPNWSADGFFRGAQGPLAPFYHALIPDYEFHRWDAYILSPRRIRAPTVPPWTGQQTPSPLSPRNPISNGSKK